MSTTTRRTGPALLSSAGLGSIDGADGIPDGTIDLQYAPSPPNTWVAQGFSVCAAGDVDGSDSRELVLGDSYTANAHVRRAVC